MKFLKRPTNLVATLLVMVLLLSACATVDQQPGVVVNPETTDGQTAVITDTTAMTDTTSTTATTGNVGISNATNVLVTATSLTDYNFENIDGEVSGSIQDVILDLTTGNVLYVTVEYGGFLDIGDTELPMPLNAFNWGSNGQLVLNFDEAALNDFPDLGTDWPDTTQAGWDAEVRSFWNGIGLDTGREMTASGDNIVRVADLIGFGVSDNGLGVSNVDDMLIDLGQSTVEYVVLAYDTSVVGNDLVLVPFNAFDTSVTGDQLALREDIDSTMIENAPRISRDALVAGDNQAFTDMNSYWGGLGYGPAITMNDQVAQQDTITSEEQGLTVTEGVGVSGANNQLVRASTLLDYNTTNLNGEDIGEIEDLLIDVETGHILYATLEYGGFLDIGDREIPLPLSALSWVSENELMLSLDEQQLDALPDVGQNWPDVTDTTWNDNIVDFWNNNGFDPGYGASDAQTIMYASNLIDYDFGDVGLGSNGSINDMLVDLSQSEALWVIVDYGGLFNDQLVPIPFSAIDVSAAGDNFSFTPNVDLNMFENAPSIDPNSFDQNSLFDNSFDDDITTYWEDAGYTVGTDANMNQ